MADAAAASPPRAPLRPAIVVDPTFRSVFSEFFDSPWALGADILGPQDATPHALDGRDVVLIEHGDLVPLGHLMGAHRVTLFNTEHAARPSVFKRVQAQWAALCDALGPGRVALADFSRANLRAWLPLLPPRSALTLMPIETPSARVQELRALLQRTPKEHDVAFVGAMTKRRLDVLHGLAAHGLRVVRVDAWGAVRDELIAKSRVLLNVHQSPFHAVFESPRCAAWIAAGMPLVTEAGLSGCTDDDPPSSAAVTVAEYAELIGVARAAAVAHGARPGSVGTLTLKSTDASRFANEEAPGFTC